LKFNRSFEKYGDGGVVMRYPQTLVARLASKLVLDILPATTASLVGGLLFAHYGLGRATESAAQVAPASAEMMQLLRDEHGLIISFLNGQLEREKTELASGDALRHGNGEAAATANVPARNSATGITGKPVVPRARVTIAATASAPLVIAQVQEAESPSAPPSPAPQAFIAKTIGLKDHVVSVTYRVVAALGEIPSWVGLIGDHFGGTNTKLRPLPATIAAS
jgi:hypothetical protein